MQRTFSSKDSIGLPEVCISMIESENVLPLSLQQLQFCQMLILSGVMNMKSQPHSYNKRENKAVKSQNNCNNDRKT